MDSADSVELLNGPIPRIVTELMVDALLELVDLGVLDREQVAQRLEWNEQDPPVLPPAEFEARLSQSLSLIHISEPTRQ